MDDFDSCWKFPFPFPFLFLQCDLATAIIPPTPYPDGYISSLRDYSKGSGDRRMDETYDSTGPDVDRVRTR